MKHDFSVFSRGKMCDPLLPRVAISSPFLRISLLSKAEVIFALKRAGHHKLFAPRLQGHGLLENMVETASASGHRSQSVAIEDCEGLAVV